MKHKDNARGFIRLFSLECLAIALSIFPLLHTHAAPHQANEKGVVQEIVESRDSAVILFGRAQNMFALLFDDFDITLRNNDNKTIIASGRAKIGDYIRNNYDSNYRMVSFITYKIKIDCKDYKYRYSISDIKITTFSNLFETPQFDWISFWCAWSDYGLINTPYFTYGNAKIKTEIYSYTISEIYASYQRDSAVISKYDEAAKLYYAALNKTKRKSDRKNLFEQLRQVNLSKMSMSNKYKALKALNTIAPIYIMDLCDKIKDYMGMHDDF